MQTKIATLLALLFQAAFVFAIPRAQDEPPEEASTRQVTIQEPNGSACEVDLTCASLSCVSGKCADTAGISCTTDADCTNNGFYYCGLLNKKCTSLLVGLDLPDVVGGKRPGKLPGNVGGGVLKRDSQIGDANVFERRQLNKNPLAFANSACSFARFFSPDSQFSKDCDKLGVET
ncbi:hypothetical protein AJ80_03373 [Polytolypa hystricis UAMH7299]|uniref:Uncharacterized protein n=1 Tax=Polytolypa hystricis (strain UAMH7299) TaxID=1447883 RepID=A0A2B7YKE7_POLH7|nr:hypothetical protein AJ80_03373 [Polytolypa hystricis UAMH7299]